MNSPERTLAAAVRRTCIVLIFENRFLQAPATTPDPSLLGHAAVLLPRGAGPRTARPPAAADGPGIELTPVAAPTPAIPPVERRGPPRARDVQSLVARGYSEAVALQSLQLALGDLEMAFLLAAAAPPATTPTPPAAPTVPLLLPPAGRPGEGCGFSSAARMEAEHERTSSDTVASAGALSVIAGSVPDSSRGRANIAGGRASPSRARAVVDL